MTAEYVPLGDDDYRPPDDGVSADDFDRLGEAVETGQIVDPRDELGARRHQREHPTTRTSRIPPHNLEAEESLLGAMLLSPDAVDTVAELGMSAGDFYKPGHQYVYDAVQSLNATGHPVDVVTVADELRRAGLLDAAGGIEYLHGLQNATPAISSAARYAAIVVETSRQRQLTRPVQ